MSRSGTASCCKCTQPAVSRRFCALDHAVAHQVVHGDALLDRAAHHVSLEQLHQPAAHLSLLLRRPLGRVITDHQRHKEVNCGRRHDRILRKRAEHGEESLDARAELLMNNTQRRRYDALLDRRLLQLLLSSGRSSSRQWPLSQWPKFAVCELFDNCPGDAQSQRQSAAQLDGL
eukprot:4508083-Prymnesium_polylepis.1